MRGREDGWKVSHVGQSGHGDGLQWCVGHRHSLRWRLQTEMFSRVERLCESEIFAGWSSLTSLGAVELPDQRLEVNGFHLWSCGPTGSSREQDLDVN